MSVAPVEDPSTHTAIMLSEVAPPTRTDSAPQQASTQPGDDGSKVHTGKDMHQETPVVVGETPAQATGKVPFKERVLGVAKKTRGTMLGNTQLKEHGNQILEGQVTSQEPPKLE